MHQAAHHQASGGHFRQTPPPATDQLPAAPQPAAPSAGGIVGLLDDNGAAAFFGCSKRTFCSFMGADWMPQPINLGPRLRRWSLDELRAAVANMPRETGREQPASLLRSRIDRMKQTGVAA